MEIIKKFSHDQAIDPSLLQRCREGRWFNWKRTFLLCRATDGKIAVVSLNLFERMKWALQTFFCRRHYSNFENVFKTKNVKIISPSDLKPADKKTQNQTNSSLNGKDHKIETQEKEPSKATDPSLTKNHATDPQHSIEDKEPEESAAKTQQSEADLNEDKNVIQAEKESSISEPEFPPLKKLEKDDDEKLCLKIAEKYIEQEKLDEAAKALDKIIYLSDERNELYTTLAKDYYEKLDLEKALYYNIYNHDLESCKALYIQIARTYKEQRKDAEALEVLRVILEHGKLVTAHYSGIARKHLEKNQYKPALHAIERSFTRK